MTRQGCDSVSAYKGGGGDDGQDWRARRDYCGNSGAVRAPASMRCLERDRHKASLGNFVREKSGVVLQATAKREPKL